ncbi:MAG: ATP-grasp fold amidoligase family protein [Candidatus Omnitrophota bacterium]
MFVGDQNFGEQGFKIVSDYFKNITCIFWNKGNAAEKRKKTAEYMEKPVQLDSMISLAELLGTPFDFIRVDLYLVNGRIYFGALTNYPESGRTSFTPVSHDFELGSKWKLVHEYWKHKNYVFL